MFSPCSAGVATLTFGRRTRSGRGSGQILITRIAEGMEILTLMMSPSDLLCHPFSHCLLGQWTCLAPTCAFNVKVRVCVLGSTRHGPNLTQRVH